MVTMFNSLFCMSQEKRIRSLAHWGVEIKPGVKEHLFGAGMLATMDWTMVALSSQNVSGYAGSDGGVFWEKRYKIYKVC